jgi:hypothetical protein
MDIEKMVFEKVKKDVEDRIRRVRCPDHPGTLRARSSGSSLKNLEWRVEACCPKGKAALDKAIQG